MLFIFKWMFYLYFKSYCNGLGPKSVKLGLAFILQPLFKYTLHSYGKQILIIHKTCEVYSLWFFEELLELIGISRGVHLDLSNGNFQLCGRRT
jgi:hypothetical protein